jgi:hypothetical protein
MYFLRTIGQTVSAAAFIAGVLSLAILANQGFGAGFSAALTTVLSYYQTAAVWGLGWLEPIIDAALKGIGAAFDIELQVRPHWKHFFVLLSLYFVSDAKANFILRRIAFAAFTVIWGLIVALATAAGVGSIDISAGESSLLTILIPVGGLIAFEIGRTMWSMAFGAPSSVYQASSGGPIDIFFFNLFSFILPIALLGSAAVALSQWPGASKLLAATYNPGLAILFALVMVLAFYWTLRGAWVATFRRAEGERWADRFWSSGSTRHGIAIFGILLGLAAFLILNAGLNVVGL